MSEILRPDLAIIGSGSGNSLITEFFDTKQVVLADQGIGPRRAFGGTCLNVGCIPTKMLVRPATLARTGEEAARLGVQFSAPQTDWVAMRDRIFSRVDAISEGGKDYRDGLENVELITDQVRLTGPKSFRSRSGIDVEAEQLVIAAGSRPFMPEVPGIDLPQVHTSDSVMRLDSLPHRILILGGGYIACEFAGIFSGLGVEVIQVNRSQGLMRRLDADIAAAFSAEAQRHWEVRYRRTVAGITETQPGNLDAPVTVELVTPEGSVEQVTADLVLCAIGRIPNSDLVGAQRAGLDVLDDGRVAVDSYQRVLSDGQPVTGLYALGDISSEPMLKHVANHEARVVAHNLENPDRLRMSRQHAIPSAVFSYPEMAQVGMTEAQAVDALGAEHVTVKIQRYGDTAYGWAMEDEQGIVKVLADRRDGQLLGAHAMGYQASNLIQPVVQGMSFGQDAYSVARGQYWIHPALNEVVENALLGLDVPIGEDAPL